MRIIPKQDISSSLPQQHWLGSKAMKVQYLGDVNDYRKFGLLRLFMRIPDLKIGVCWLLTPDDKTKDGGKRQYLTKEVERGYDTDLFNALADIKEPPDMDEFNRLERHEILNGITFFNERTPCNRDKRDLFHSKCLEHLKYADLVFFDPDNGIEVKSLPYGRKKSNKYVFLNELKAHWECGKSLLIYQHFPRKNRDLFIDEQCNRLSRELQIDGEGIFALRTPHVVFFLVAQPRHVKPFEQCVLENSGGWIFSTPPASPRSTLNSTLVERPDPASSSTN